MKVGLLYLAFILCTSYTLHIGPVDQIGVPGPLTFNKTSFSLAWVSHPNANYYIQEYLPAGESTSHFTQMLSLYFLSTELSIEDAVRQKVAELEKRKSTDATCNYEVHEEPEKKELMLDFVLGESKNGNMTIAEFNVYRYKAVDLGNGSKGIVLYAYSKRAEGDGIRTFYKSLSQQRVKSLTEMSAVELPKVRLRNNSGQQ
jgi:hypothetical protein